MTTSLDTLVVPVRYYTALDPYNWKVDNRPMSDLEDNADVLRSGVETALNAVKTGAAVDGRLLRALVGDDKASGNWTLHPSAVSITITDSIKVKTTTDDGFDVGVIAAQYAPAVFALAIPAAGFKNLVTISARYKLPNSADMPYYDQTQVLDALAVSLATAQTKQGTMEFAIATSTVAVGAPDNYFVHGSGYDALFHIKVLKTDTVLDPSRVLAVGITKLGQSVARATNATYGQVKFATGTEVTTGTSTDTVVSPADLKGRIDAITPGAVAQATTTIYGVVKFATGTEVTAGTSTNTVVSPADLKDRIDAIPPGAVAQATTTIYGVVKFATGTEVTAGTSTNTVVSPADLATRALLGGDSLVNFKVENAVDPKDAVNLLTLKNFLSFRNFPFLVLQLSGDAAYEIPPGGKIRVQLIGGGGGGGSCTEEDAFTQNSTSGGDTYIYNETTLEVYVNARGGERGRNGNRWGHNSYAHSDSPSNFPTEFPLDAIKPSLEVIASAMGSKHISASSTYRQFHSNSYSRGGGGSPRPNETNLGNSSYGMAGSLVDTFLSNNTSFPLPIKITLGSAGQKSITYWGEGTDGQPGFAILMIYAS